MEEPIDLDVILLLGLQCPCVEEIMKAIPVRNHYKLNREL